MHKSTLSILFTAGFTTAFVACDVTSEPENQIEMAEAIDESESEALPEIPATVDQASPSEPAPETPIGPEQVANRPDTQAAGTPDCSGINPPVPGWCRYQRVATTNDDDVRAVCNSGTYPVSGGCWTETSAKLKRSHPDEGVEDTVDDGDFLSDATGWSCRYDAAPSGGLRHIAVAMCCVQTIPAVCTL